MSLGCVAVVGAESTDLYRLRAREARLAGRIVPSRAVPQVDQLCQR